MKQTNKKTKWKSNFKSTNLKKNWKVITMYLAIVTVTIEIIMEMIVMLMNKDNNK